MNQTVYKTRFAPSPTGYVHLGNVRTALFSALLAQRHDGIFLVRIEDTDQARSRPEYETALQEDMRWLGVIWQEGPGVNGEAGPYRQSERDGIYRRYFEMLEHSGGGYPCFCSDHELKLARKAQLAAGRPPRYSGKCATLTPQEVSARRAAGQAPVLRFRVPAGQVVKFDDLVRGQQVFRTEEIGDFVIRRADGSAAFFFSNAIDDALMLVSHVLRGEDHLSNTPRQIMLLEALGLRVPAYGHIPLIVGPDGAPLSKRHGSRSLRELRDLGFLPEAIVNYLARLGHTYDSDTFQNWQELSGAFTLERIGRAPARYDEQQLLFWQQKAVAGMSDDALWQWLGAEVAAQVPPARRQAFVDAVRPNVVFPRDALKWARVFFEDDLVLNEVAREVMAAAGAEFFRAALAALTEHPGDFAAFADNVKARTQARGKALFMPLRAALTGELGGPEMARVLPLLTPALAQARLEAGLSLQR